METERKGWHARTWTCHKATTVVVADPEHFSGLRVVAECGTESEANLIAAAPDLLASLETLLLTMWPEDRENYKSRIAKAEEAIAKARGQS